MATVLYQWGDLEATRLRKEHPNHDWQEWKIDTVLNDPYPANAVGTVEWTRALFKRLGWTRIRTVGGPSCLAHRHLVTRPSWESLLKNVKPGNFVKPLPADMKAWTGQVVTRDELDALIQSHGPYFECEEQPAVEFHNEWRLFFANDGKRYRLKGGAAYPVDEPRILNTFLRGRSLDMPSFALQSYIEDTLDSLDKYDIPSGLVVDVGQDINDEWHVVEVGDCWAMGTYGAGVAYLQAQEIRFVELIRANQ